MDPHTLELLSFADPILDLLEVPRDTITVACLDDEGLVLEWEDYMCHSEHIPLAVLLDPNPVKAFETLRNHRRMDFYQGLRASGSNPMMMQLLERLRTR